MKVAKNKKRFTLTDKIILGLNILVCLALLLSYLAPGTDPRDSEYIALLGFGYLYIAATSLLFVFYWIFRKPVLTLLSVITFLLGFGTLMDFIAFHGKSKPTAAPPAGAIRVMQYNVHKFKGLERYLDMPIQNEVGEVVIDQQPDIVTMVEFNRNKKESDTLINNFKNKIGLGYSYFLSYTRGIDSVGNMIFSKYPIISSGAIGSTSLLNTKVIYTDVSYNKKTIRIYSMHLAAVTMNDKQKKGVLKGNISFEKAFFIKDRLAAAYVYRSFQVDKIKEHMKACPYPYIVTGDFNDTPNSYSVSEIGDGLKNAFQEKGSGFQTTYYALFPLQIDYIFATKQFDVLSYRVIDKKMSDHKPVISDLKLN